MKRDMNLIRLQLLRVEGEQLIPELEQFTEEQRIYHMALCIEAGLVHGEIRTDPKGFPNGTVAIRLTWAGHEFLDAARNETVWNKAKEKIKKSGVEVTISILQELLKKLIKDSIGLSEP